ncbi:hypothetical protein FHU29_002613 [Hoyosella altamirensis]|uniref:Uncharacterized protein n=1 Tax=Hoyosella altamirensis TaxID=616997 RepID=A0A839RPX4_9ACTN|nr:hypothetical protein [Hoyosella altamirensis]
MGITVVDAPLSGRIADVILRASMADEGQNGRHGN